MIPIWYYHLRDHCQEATFRVSGTITKMLVSSTYDTVPHLRGDALWI